MSVVPQEQHARAPRHRPLPQASWQQGQQWSPGQACLLQNAACQRQGQLAQRVALVDPVFAPMALAIEWCALDLYTRNCFFRHARLYISALFECTPESVCVPCDHVVSATLYVANVKFVLCKQKKGRQKCTEMKTKASRAGTLKHVGQTCNLAPTKDRQSRRRPQRDQLNHIIGVSA